MKQPKLIHIRNGKRNFIRFGGKPKMIVEVWQFDTENQLDSYSTDFTKDIEGLELIAFHERRYFQDKHYLFFVTQYPEGYTIEDENKIIHKLDYAVDWYLHQCINKNL